MIGFDHRPRFLLGEIVITTNAAASIPSDEIRAALRRHACGDWGELHADDWQQNEAALQGGSDLFSIYCASNGTRLYVLTDADRSRTTLLLPEDC